MRTLAPVALLTLASLCSASDRVPFDFRLPADFYTDFTTGANDYSNGWELGTVARMGDAVAAFPDYTPVGDDGISRWSDHATESALVPAAFKNTQVDEVHGLRRGEAALHGGLHGEIAVASYRFARTGVYHVFGLFGAGHFGRVDAFIASGSKSYFQVLDTPSTQTFDFLFSAVAGQNLDFGVGIGTDGYAGDTTPLSATIMPQAVPEPSAFAALGVGALGLLRRRRK